MSRDSEGHLTGVNIGFTGFPVIAVRQTPGHGEGEAKPPSTLELRVLREEVDPERMYLRDVRTQVFTSGQGKDSSKG